MRRALVCLATWAVSLAAAAQDLPPCVRVEAQARWGADAYNHFVRLENGCERRARCEVSTDVNPAVVRVELAPGESTELITFRGSPASAFTPRVRCTLDR